MTGPFRKPSQEKETGVEMTELTSAPLDPVIPPSVETPPVAEA